MDEKELAEELSESMKLHPDIAKDIVRTIFDTIAEGMVSGKEVFIPGFATFYPIGSVAISHQWFMRIRRKGLLGYSIKKGVW